MTKGFMNDLKKFPLLEELAEEMEKYGINEKSVIHLISIGLHELKESGIALNNVESAKKYEMLEKYADEMVRR